MWHNLPASSGHTQPEPKQANPVFPWSSPPTSPPKRPPPPTGTMVPTYAIYTTPRTREPSVRLLTRNDPEEQPRSFNPIRTRVQAFPKAASPSLVDGSPFTQRTTLTRHGAPMAPPPDYQDVSEDPDKSSSNPPPNRAPSGSRASFSRDPSLAESRATSVGSILPRSGDTTPREVIQNHAGQNTLRRPRPLLVVFRAHCPHS